MLGELLGLKGDWHLLKSALVKGGALNLSLVFLSFYKENRFIYLSSKGRPL